MELNNSNLRTILASIFNVDEKYIVEKAGIWFNPQSMLPSDEKPITWIAYKILSNAPVGIPYFESQTDVVDEEDVLRNYIRIPKIANIQLQFVGSQAETLANSLAFWIKRTDVITQFELVSGKLMMNDLNVISTPFFQDGLNDILAFNVNFKIAWLDEKLTTQEIVDTVEIGGSINV